MQATEKYNITCNYIDEYIIDIQNRSQTHVSNSKILNTCIHFKIIQVHAKLVRTKKFPFKFSKNE